MATPTHVEDLPQQTSSEKPECRICHEADSPENMIDPCACSGSIKWVHRKCLDEWRVAAPDPKAFFECTTCHTKYDLMVNTHSNRMRIFLVIILTLTRDYTLGLGGIFLASWALGKVVSWSDTIRFTFTHFLMGVTDQDYVPPFWWRNLFGFLVTMSILGVILTIWGVVRMVADLFNRGQDGYYGMWDECCCRDPYCCFYTMNMQADCLHGIGDCNGQTMLALLIIFALIGILLVLTAGIVHTVALIRRHVSKVKRRSEVLQYAVVSRSNALHVV
ncbi:putative E3 ubiquitin-protein ligase MARCH5 [Paratrimastix pyriformis]|uniref:E3 ubiquitin-protein ligase MARCH5 n=1 Tax=Paratrimastix pyriformis TaxID=342808 RepID=A0ABQ8UWH8_9EUKA|nr:putative E3 ubiquitin-protein ligase MARCH5 [Paratrimastix pyriformis]